MSSIAVPLPRQPAVPLGHLWNWPSPAPEPYLILETFIDYCCPFSAKIFNRLTEEVIPAYNNGDSPRPRIKLIFQQVPQPWHPQSSLMHESVCAIRHLYGIQATNDYQRLLFASRDQFVDAVVMDESRTSISQRLAALAATLDGVEEEAVMERLKVIVTDTQKNSGSASIRVLKFYVKQHRQLGIHVTPTCRINGMIVETSSSWTLKEWQDYLDPMISLSEGGYKRN